MYREVKFTSTSLSATVNVDSDVIVNLYAQKSSNSSTNVSIIINSYEKYLANQQECDEAIEEFKQHVEEMTEEAD